MTRSPLLTTLLEQLEDGEWHDGMGVVRALERTIPPGEASRIGERRRKGTGATTEDLIRSGRRDKTRDVINSALARGRVETDPPQLGKRAWSGVEPWKIRDPQAGYLSVIEMANELGVLDNVVRTWAVNGYVPHTATPAGHMRFSPEQAAIVRRVATAYVPGSLRWNIDPRSLWNEAEVNALPTITCPHCHEQVTLVAGKP